MRLRVGPEIPVSLPLWACGFCKDVAAALPSGLRLLCRTCQPLARVPPSLLVWQRIQELLGEAQGWLEKQ